MLCSQSRTFLLSRGPSPPPAVLTSPPASLRVVHTTPRASSGTMSLFSRPRVRQLLPPGPRWPQLPQRTAPFTAALPVHLRVMEAERARVLCTVCTSTGHTAGPHAQQQSALCKHTLCPRRMCGGTRPPGACLRTASPGRRVFSVLTMGTFKAKENSSAGRGIYDVVKHRLLV